MPTIVTTKETAENMPERERNDYYPTPVAMSQRGVQLAAKIENKPRRILDPGAGGGSWGWACRQVFGHSPKIHGVEYRETPKPEPYNTWHCGGELGNFLHWRTDHRYDMVVGNPPYKYAEQFIRQGMKFLHPGGVMVFLLQLHFLAGVKRTAGLWQEFPPKTVYVIDRRPSFDGSGQTGVDNYGFYVWEKGESGPPVIRWESVPKSGLYGGDQFVTPEGETVEQMSLL